MRQELEQEIRSVAAELLAYAKAKTEDRRYGFQVDGFRAAERAILQTGVFCYATDALVYAIPSKSGRTSGSECRLRIVLTHNFYLEDERPCARPGNVRTEAWSALVHRIRDGDRVSFSSGFDLTSDEQRSLIEAIEQLTGFKQEKWDVTGLDLAGPDLSSEEDA